LDGAKNYRLHIPANIPAGNFWSVLVYDALSRSQLQNGQPYPSVSSYTKPVVNADGSIDIALGPDEPKDKGNWIKTDRPRQRFFPMFRFYGSAEAFFNKTWQLEDVVAVKMTSTAGGCGAPSRPVISRFRG